MLRLAPHFAKSSCFSHSGPALCRFEFSLLWVLSTPLYFLCCHLNNYAVCSHCTYSTTVLTLLASYLFMHNLLLCHYPPTLVAIHFKMHSEVWNCCQALSEFMGGSGSVPAVAGQWMQGLYLDNAVQC